MSGVAVRNLSVDFATPGGTAHVLRDLSFDIGAGKMLGLVGESGSGKSTAAFALMGLLAASGTVTTGTARIGGRNFDLTQNNATAELRGRGMAMIFQDPLLSLNPVFTIKAHLFAVIRRAAPEIDAETRFAMAEAALAQVGLSEPGRRLRQYPHELSGGMRQRVIIAMALLAKPVLLIADEPTTALDVTVEAQVMAEICKLRDTIGCSVLLITHSLGLVTRYCDAITVLYAGERLESGEVESVRRQPGHPYSRLLFDCEIAIDAVRAADAKRNRFKVIGGALPPLDRRISGCIFQPRCDVVMPQCADIVPDDRPVNGSGRHTARCLRLEPA